MTPVEQIAYLRSWLEKGTFTSPMYDALVAVCDLAERALLTDDETEAVRAFLNPNDRRRSHPMMNVLRRLLDDERVEHRSEAHALDYTSVDFDGWSARCICGKNITGDTLDAAVRAWAAHAGIGQE